MINPQQDRERLAVRVVPGRRTTVDHYPMASGQVVVRWRDHPTDPDARGYIVEANVGGVIVEGAGHYGTNREAAAEDGRHIAAALLSREPVGEAKIWSPPVGRHHLVRHGDGESVNYHECARCGLRPGEPDWVDKRCGAKPWPGYARMARSREPDAVRVAVYRDGSMVHAGPLRDSYQEIAGMVGYGVIKISDTPPAPERQEGSP